MKKKNQLKRIRADLAELNQNARYITRLIVDMQRDLFFTNMPSYEETKQKTDELLIRYASGKSLVDGQSLVSEPVKEYPPFLTSAFEKAMYTMEEDLRKKLEDI